MTDPGDQAVTTNVPEVFRPFYEGVITNDRLEAVRAALPFDRVSLERSGGMIIPGGSFKLTLSRNGEATLWSDGAATFGGSGSFVGTVSIFDFGKLSHLVVEAGVERLAPRYAVGWTDQQTMTVSVSTPRSTFAVADYGGAAPVQLWSVEQAVMAIGHSIHWKPK